MAFVLSAQSGAVHCVGGLFLCSDILDFENDDTESEQPSEQDKEDSGQIEINEENTEPLE